MGYSEYLADRISRSLDEMKVRYEEKKMFGGLCFMVDSKMCIGINDDKLMARVGPDFYDEALTKSGAETMEFTGRPMKGYVYVRDQGIDSEEDLNFWIKRCLEFNLKAKSSRKK